jgi:hypothetical protein
MLRDESSTKLFQLMTLPLMFLLHPMKIKKESVGLGKAPQIVTHTNLALCPEIGMIQYQHRDGYHHMNMNIGDALNLRLTQCYCLFMSSYMLTDNKMYKKPPKMTSITGHSVS